MKVAWEPRVSERTFWRAQEQGIAIGFPGVMYVDNAAGISFQNRTNADSKLKGCFDLREAWVKELQDRNLVRTVKVDTLLNIADLLTKCQSATAQNRLLTLIDDRIIELVRSDRI